MNFSAYTLMITYFMAGLGIWAVTLVEAVDRAFIFSIGALIVISLASNIKKRAIIPAGLWNFLAAAVLIFFILDYLSLSKSLIVAASRFLTVLLALKLFDIKRTRDYLLAYSLVFFQILAAAASTVSPVFFLILSLFLVAGIWAMTVFNIKRDFQREHPDSEDIPVVFGVKFFISTIFVSAGSLVITFVLFFIIPRMGVGFFERKTLNTVKVTGFSDKVDLGSIGPVKKDPTIIMRVEVKAGGSPATLYFRGTALDHYDGVSWSNKVKDSRLIRREPSGVFRLGYPGGPLPRGSLIEQTILLEPLDTEVIFAASHAVTVEGNFPGIRTDSTGSMHLPSPPYSRVSYRALSSPSPVAAGPEEIAPELRENQYLDTTPAGARIKALSADITRQARTGLEKAEAIENHLKANYTYSLDPKKGAGQTPVEDFLFYSKQGYCEHYATAMVVLLRYSGVPARIVTGFLQGEWNGYGNYFIVRQQDAHSWVEAYIDGKGWMTFDPTPPAGFIPFYRPSRISLYMDLLRWKWDRHVIHFTSDDQRKMAESLETGTSSILTSLRSLRPSTALKKNYVIPAVLLIIFVTAMVFFQRRIFKSAGKYKAPEFYIKMLKLLGKKGFKKRPDETPLEFAERTGAPAVRAITLAYHSERFGGARLKNDELELVKKALKELEGR